MIEQQIRLECLKLAATLPHVCDPQMLSDAARTLYTFLHEANVASAQSRDLADRLVAGKPDARAELADILVDREPNP